MNAHQPFLRMVSGLGAQGPGVATEVLQGSSVNVTGRADEKLL